MKRRLRISLTLLFLLAGSACYLLLSNALTPKTVFIPAGALALVNWQDAGGGLISGDDPQIVLQDMRYIGFLSSVALEGVFDGDLNPQIYFNRFVDWNFSDRKSFFPGYALDGGALTVPVSRLVKQLRVDPGDGAGIALSGLRGARLTYAFKANPVHLSMAAFVSLFIAVLAVSPGLPRRLFQHAGLFGKYAYLLSNLIKKDITVKYRRSALGILWSVLNPLLMMFIITAVFRNIFRLQIENFPLYYLTGSLLFGFMSEATTLSMGSVLESGGLIQKVYIPKYIFPLEKCLFALINTLFSFIAVIIMLPVLRAPFHWTLLLFFVPVLLVLVFSAGLGMALASLTVFFRDIKHLYSVWLMAWMYLTPILYPIEILPRPIMSIARMNPMYHYVVFFRDLVMHGRLPGFDSVMTCLMLSLGFFMFGLLVFKKTQDRFILYI